MLSDFELLTFNLTLVDADSVIDENDDDDDDIKTMMMMMSNMKP